MLESILRSGNLMGKNSPVIVDGSMLLQIEKSSILAKVMVQQSFQRILTLCHFTDSEFSTNL